MKSFQYYLIDFFIWCIFLGFALWIVQFIDSVYTRCAVMFIVGAVPDILVGRLIGEKE